MAKSVAGYSRWGWVETFVAIQFLASGVLLLPGTQPLRILVRALPYAASMAILLLYLDKQKRLAPAPGGRATSLVLLVLLVNLMHPGTPFPAGMAQVVFQICILGPIFWAAKAVRSIGHLEQVIWVLFGVTAVNVIVGILQVLMPEYFMPAQLTAGIDPAVLAMMSYTGANGEMITRPPGLSDIPGGAAAAAMLAGVLGIALGLQPGRNPLMRVVCFGVAAAAMVTLYLTQGRAMMIMMVVSLVVLSLLSIRRGQLYIAGVCAALVLGSFTLATMIGGDVIASRFNGILQSGLLTSYSENRGAFLSDTFTNLLPRYPFGAGLGRWGMMQMYFGPFSSNNHPMYAEIQLTGWLLDGGVLMWAAYGLALVVSLWYSYKLAVRSRNASLGYAAGVVLCVQIALIGTAMAGPTFNTQLGIVYWLLTGALYGAEEFSLRRVARLDLYPLPEVEASARS